MLGPPTRIANPLRVGIVDDDDLSRRGIAEILAEDDRLTVVAALNHADALTASWADVDVAVVDAADERRSDDHFPGVEVVRAIRKSRPIGTATIIVITGHFFDDAVRHRMREARADLFFHRTEVQDASRLCAVVAESERETRTVPAMSDPGAAFRLGVGKSVRVNDAVQFAAEQGWLDGALEQPARRSRSWDGLRRSFSRAAGLHTVNADGTLPDRHQEDPSRTQIAKFVAWATRSKSNPRT